jgi:hypothetical protein
MSTPRFVIVTILILLLSSTGAQAEPSAAFEHEFTRECRVVQKYLQLAATKANSTAQTVQDSLYAQIHLEDIQDR